MRLSSLSLHDIFKRISLDSQHDFLEMLVRQYEPECRTILTKIKEERMEKELREKFATEQHRLQEVLKWEQTMIDYRVSDGFYIIGSLTIDSRFFPVLYISRNLNHEIVNPGTPKWQAIIDREWALI